MHGEDIFSEGRMKIPAEWLVQRVEEAPTSYTPTEPKLTPLQVRMAWQKLKGRARGGDEIWAFANPADTRRKLGRHSGYALVREGSIVETVVLS
jgi:hypothetical protein